MRSIATAELERRFETMQVAAPPEELLSFVFQLVGGIRRVSEGVAVSVVSVPLRSDENGSFLV